MIFTFFANLAMTKIIIGNVYFLELVYIIYVFIKYSFDSPYQKLSKNNFSVIINLKMNSYFVFNNAKN